MNSEVYQNFMNSNEIYVKEQRKEQIRSKLELDPLSSLRENKSQLYLSKINYNDQDNNEAQQEDKQIIPKLLNFYKEIDEAQISTKIFSESFKQYQDIRQQPSVKEEFQQMISQIRKNRSESCEQSQSFYNSYVQNKLNKVYVFGEGQQKKTIDLSYKKEDYGQQNQKQILDTEKPKKMQNLQQSLKKLPYDNNEDKKPLKFDFAKLNQVRANTNFKLKQPEYIGDLPTEIKSISQMDQDELQNLVCPENQTELCDDISKIRKGNINQIKKPLDIIEEQRTIAINTDIIEQYSLAPQKQKGLDANNIYREIGPIGRELINLPQDVVKTENLEFLSDKEFLFDKNQPEWGDMMNIISGRITQNQLQQIIYKTGNCFEQSIIESEADKSKNQSILQRSRLTSNIGQNNNINNNNDINNNNNLVKQNSTDRLSLLQDNPITINKISTKEVEMKAQQQLYQQSTTQRFSKEIQTDEYLLDAYEEEQQAQEEQIKQKTLTKLFGKTDYILRDISKIKQKKQEFEEVLKREEAKELRQQINLKLDNLLVDLLSVIVDNTNSGKVIEKEQVGDQLKKILNNMDELSGKKTPEGFQKTHLLFQFLQEYKELQQERETFKIKKQTVVRKKQNLDTNLRNLTPKKNNQLRNSKSQTPLKQNNTLVNNNSNNNFNNQQSTTKKSKHERFVGLNKSKSPMKKVMSSINFHQQSKTAEKYKNNNNYNNNNFLHTTTKNNNIQSNNKNNFTQLLNANQKLSQNIKKTNNFNQIEDQNINSPINYINQNTNDGNQATERRNIQKQNSKFSLNQSQISTSRQKVNKNFSLNNTSYLNNTYNRY